MMLAFVAIPVVAVLGVLVLLVGFKPELAPEFTSPSAAANPRLARWKRNLQPTRNEKILLIVGAIVGFVLFAASGQILALLATPLALWTFSRVASSARAQAHIDKLDALTKWTRLLAGSIAANSSLEPAIIRTRRHAPPEIAAQVNLLAARIAARADTRTALREFADGLDDPTADLICLTLMANAKQRGSGLVAALEDLSDDISREVRNRREINADRRTQRFAVKGMVIISVTVLFALAVSGDYLEPLTHGTGLVIAVVLSATFIFALAWMAKLAAGKQHARLLEPVS